jgi:mRNA interferase HigB
MRIVARGTQVRFSTANADARAPLDDWYDVTRYAAWSKPQDVVETFGKRVSILPNNRVVFDIGGNKYRLVAVILYRSQILYVRFIGKHAAYDRIDATTI